MGGRGARGMPQFFSLKANFFGRRVSYGIIALKAQSISNRSAYRTNSLYKNCKRPGCYPYKLKSQGLWRT
ncbi:hypothetical protein MKW98_007806 [Papaver atlanticum]|uniref:Uncharacterized protein n=1 Tax=Papaver atlanticum TaxID=357466 RepID=A0AAD4X5P1_9MAGN|nr:hypothetical protein MKW98_007806 [Papaver atlanticum]